MVKVKTGEKVKISGQYRIIGSTREITLVAGKKVPPTNIGKKNFVLVDRTKHSK